jgi:hypothetical protein
MVPRGYFAKRGRVRPWKLTEATADIAKRLVRIEDVSLSP